MEGVSEVFGNPGSTEVPFIDTLVNYPRTRYVLALHEGEAVAMADGYARASGKVGVVSVHAAPGTANTLGNLYNAYIDNIPLVILAGQQDSRMLVRQPYLSADLARLASQFTKWSWQVSRVEELTVALRRAFKEATSPPAGPVFLALSRNVLDETTEYEDIPASKFTVSDRTRGDIDEVHKAAELLVAAKSLIVVAGERVGRAGAVAELVELAEMLGARVYGEASAFPTGHPQYIGPIERQIGSLANEGDTFFAVGIRLFPEFSYSAGPMFPKETSLVHLDINPWEIAKNIPVDAGIVANIKIGLRELISETRELLDSTRLEAIEQRLGEVKRRRATVQDALERDLRAVWDAVPIRVPRLLKEMQEVLPYDAIIIDQSIRSATYLRRYFEFTTPGTYFSEGGGSLGWGIGAAVGAQLARPDRRVVGFLGDGSANFGPKSLWTAAKYNIPVVIIVINNRGYAAVKGLLLSYKGEAAKQGTFVGTEISGLDYVKLAEAYGVRGWRVERPEEIGPTLKQALGSGGPALLEVVVDPKDLGFGMPLLQ